VGKEVGQEGHRVDIVGHPRWDGQPSFDQRSATAGRAAVAWPATSGRRAADRRLLPSAGGDRLSAAGRSLSVQTGCNCGSCGLYAFFSFFL
jgi:hypothetical protein